MPGIPHGESQLFLRPSRAGMHVAPQARMKAILARIAFGALVLCCGTLVGCGARTSIGSGVAGSACPGLAPTCVGHGGDPCGPWQAVAASCDASSRQWSCPSGSRLYARAPEQATTCLPFHDEPGIASIGSSLVRVPTDDGRCLWIAEDVSFTDASAARNVAFEADPNAPFGTCPKTSVTPPAPAVVMAGGDDPSILIQIDGGYRIAGKTHVIYRVFQIDANATFGIDELGGGVASWDGSQQRIVVPALGSFPWGLDLDLGDAILPEGDHAYVWGCPQPPDFLTEQCKVARLDASDAVTLYGKSGQWIPSTSGADGANVFDSGPWTSSVVPRGEAGGLLHVYAIGFGSDLQTQVAPIPSGAWTVGPGLGPCDLPAADDQSYCAGPVVHEEIDDPTRSGEWAITYGVGTTGPRTSHPDDYWTRLVWVK